MAIENNDLVVAYHQTSGEKLEVPAHFLGAGSPFPGQWAKTPPTAPAADEPAAKKEK